MSQINPATLSQNVARPWYTATKKSDTGKTIKPVYYVRKVEHDAEWKAYMGLDVDCRVQIYDGRCCMFWLTQDEARQQFTLGQQVPADQQDIITNRMEWEINR